MKLNFIILGPQGSGKTTQAELLAKKLHSNYISTGTIIHETISHGSEFAKQLLGYIKNGGLVPDEILIKKILFPEIKKIEANKGIVFEGVPRNLTQMQELDKYFRKNHIVLPWLIHISIPQNTSFKRLALRKFCAECGANYKPSHPNYFQNKCSRCQGKLIIREDDRNKNSIVNRLAIYGQQTRPVINYFRDKKKIIEINGEKTIDKVHQEIISKIKSLDDKP